MDTSSIKSVITFNLDLGICIQYVNKLHQLCLHSKFLPHHYALTQHNEVQSIGVAYLVRLAGRDLILSKDTMLPNTTDDRDVEDAMSLQDDEGLIDEMIEVPATSEDLQTFHAATTEEEDTRGNSWCVTGNLVKSPPPPLLPSPPLPPPPIVLMTPRVGESCNPGCSATGSDRNCLNISPGQKSQASLRGRFCSQKRSDLKTMQKMRR